MLRFFGAPRFRAQKTAAKSAKCLRELVGRELTVEVQMLAQHIQWGDQQRFIAFDQGDNALVSQIAMVTEEGQDFLTNLGRCIDAVVSEVSDMWRRADTADDYERLATYELTLREDLLKLRDQGRVHVGAIGEAAMTVRPRG